MTKSPINTSHALIDWTMHLCMTELSSRIQQLAIYGIPFRHRSCFWQLIALQAKIWTWRCRLPIALGLTVQAWWCFPASEPEHSYALILHLCIYPCLMSCFKSCCTMRNIASFKIHDIFEVLKFKNTLIFTNWSVEETWWFCIRVKWAQRANIIFKKLNHSAITCTKKDIGQLKNFDQNRRETKTTPR